MSGTPASSAEPPLQTHTHTHTHTHGDRNTDRRLAAVSSPCYNLKKPLSVPLQNIFGRAHFERKEEDDMGFTAFTDFHDVTLYVFH